MDVDSEYSIQIIDQHSRNVQSPSQWLDVGRESFATLCTPHTVVLSRDKSTVAEGVVSLTGEDWAVAKLEIVKLASDINSEEFAAFLYCLLREARIAQCTDFAIGERDRLSVFDDLSAQPDLQTRIDYATHVLADSLCSSLNTFIRDLFAKEVERTVEHHIEMFLKESWPATIVGAGVNRKRYIKFLFNLHGYVRMTTRLLGQCVACSQDTQLRTHYIHHLNGEINHEKIIESDLASLGIDVNYLTKQYVPSTPTQQFLAIQQSTVGFLSDPVLFLACPIAAESFAAYAKQEILVGLQHSIASWYSGDPRNVTHFVTSHTQFDGGADGHWIKCIEILKDYVCDEIRAQQFLGILNTSMATLRNMFNANV